METKDCPKCGKKAILCFTGIELTSYPPQYPREWRCACGHREKGPTLRGKTEEEVFLEKWKQANADTPTSVPSIG